MTLRRYALVFALALALFPTSSIAQEAAPPPQEMQPSPCASHRPQTTPPEDRIYDRLVRRLGPANLTQQQQAQIQQLVATYSQAHPAGSPLDRAAMRDLRARVMALLTPAQMQAVEAATEANRNGGGHQRRPCAP
jgi:hypothetical protein